MINRQKRLDFLNPTSPTQENPHLWILISMKRLEETNKQSGVPLVKQYWKPAPSTSLALRPSKQAGPWWTPGNSRICLSAFAGGFLSPKQAVIAWNRLEVVKIVWGFGFRVWVLMGATKEPFLKFANGKEWACEKGLLKKERAWSLLATTADDGFMLEGWSSVSLPLCVTLLWSLMMKR